MANKNNALTKSLYPSKTVINFINQDKEKANWSKAGVVAGILVVIGLFIYLGFYIPVTKLNKASSDHYMAVLELEELKANNESYLDTQAEYNVRLNRFIGEDESVCENRVEMLNIVFDNILNGIEIVSISIDGYEMELIVKTLDYDNISNYLDAISSDLRVYYASVNSTNEDDAEQSDYCFATYTIVFNQELEGEA